MVREASVASRDEAEFVRRLAGERGARAPTIRDRGTRGRGRLLGRDEDQDGDTPIWFGGGKLAKDLTLPNLRQFWEQSAGDRDAAVVEWGAAKAVAPGREAIRGDPG